MKLKGVLELLRDFGTGTTIRALLSPKRTKPSETMEKHTVLLSELVATLEKKKLLRRGHILEMLNKMENQDEVTGK